MAGRPRRIGIRDIAAEAGVSKTAVSYALNGTGRLDPKTRERILEIARRLGYRANPNARNLRRQSFGVLAFATSLPPELSEFLPGMDYFMRVWQGAMSEALERGYMMLLIPFGAKPGALRNMPIDGGIVLDPQAGDQMVGHLEAQNLPVVLIGRDTGRQDHESYYVDSPHADLALEVFEHFLEQGARSIGLIQAPRRYAFSIAVRDAYLEWTAARGKKPCIIEIDGPTTELAGYAAARRMLDRPDRPDAIYASLDRLAAGTLLAADHCGIKIPRDLLLAAGSDGITRITRVPITALDLRPDQLGRSAVNMLIERIEHGIAPCRTIIPGEIAARQSTSRFAP